MSDNTSGESTLERTATAVPRTAIAASNPTSHVAGAPTFTTDVLAAASAGGAADMALEVESDVINSHMALLRSDTTLALNAATSSSNPIFIGATVADSTALSSTYASSTSSSTTYLSTPTATTSTTATTTPRTASSSVPTISAVYRWYDIEDNFHLKRKEESSIAKCTLCREQGKVERKTFVRFSKSVTSNLWRHLRENHKEVYDTVVGEKKSIQMHQVLGAKKRGRKKKLLPVATPTTAPATVNGDHDDDDVDAVGVVDAMDVEALDSDDAQTNSHVVTKKPKRSVSDTQDTDATQALHHARAAIAPVAIPVTAAAIATVTPSRMLHPNSTSRFVTTPPAAAATTATASSPLAQPPLATARINLEKVREAIGRLCLYDLVSFDVCSSVAFRNVLLACTGASGDINSNSNSNSVVHAANSVAVVGKEIARGYATKLATETNARVAMQMKRTDVAHFVLAEWPFKSNDSSNNATTFIALFAVGLDPDFHAFRRCLYVSALLDDGDDARQHRTAATRLADDVGFQHALERVVPSKFVPQILTLAPFPSPTLQACAASVCTANAALVGLESVASIFQCILLATIHGVALTDAFVIGATSTISSDALANNMLSDRRLDCDEFIESAPTVTDAFLDRLETETLTPILDELPSQLTGHGMRDVLVKSMVVVAHFKQSRASRRVLQQLALDDVGMSRDAYERTVVGALRRVRVAFRDIVDVLSLVLAMRAPLQRYFALHRDGGSEFSKLVQLASLSPFEWTRIVRLQWIIKPFADATRQLGAEPYVVSSLLIPSVFTLLSKLRDAPRPVPTTTTTTTTHNSSSSSATRCSSTNGDSHTNNINGHNDCDSALLVPEDIVALQDAAITNLSVTFGFLLTAPSIDWSVAKRQTFDLLWAATILDPRTRMFMIKGPLSQSEFWDIVKVEAANIAGAKLKDKTSEAAIALDENVDNADDSDNASKPSDLWDDLQANLTSCVHEEMLLSAAKASLELAKSTNLLEVEVSFFQDEPRISFQANPLEWWQGLRLKYPFLARLARYVLSLPFAIAMDDDNPVANDNGLVRRAQHDMSSRELCELLAASMNLRTERTSLLEASSKTMSSTV